MFQEFHYKYKWARCAKYNDINKSSELSVYELPNLPNRILKCKTHTEFVTELMINPICFEYNFPIQRISSNHFPCASVNVNTQRVHREISGNGMKFRKLNMNIPNKHFVNIWVRSIYFAKSWILNFKESLPRRLTAPMDESLWFCSYNINFLPLTEIAKYKLFFGEEILVPPIRMMSDFLPSFPFNEVMGPEDIYMGFKVDTLEMAKEGKQISQLPSSVSYTSISMEFLRSICLLVSLALILWFNFGVWTLGITV